MKQAVFAAISDKNVNNPIGVGLFNSAAIGANIVSILAMNLQNPNAECENIGGNSTENDMYKIFKFDEIPTLARRRKIGVA